MTYTTTTPEFDEAVHDFFVFLIETFNLDSKWTDTYIEMSLTNNDLVEVLFDPTHHIRGVELLDGIVATSTSKSGRIKEFRDTIVYWMPELAKKRVTRFMNALDTPRLKMRSYGGNVRMRKVFPEENLVDELTL